MIRGIRSKVMFTYIVVILIALGIFGIYVMQFLESMYMDTVKDHLRQEALFISSAITPEDKSDSLTKLVQRLKNKTNEDVTILDANGNVMNSTYPVQMDGENHAKNPEVVEAKSHSYGSAIRFVPKSNVEALYVAVPIRIDGHINGYVQISTPVDAIHLQLQRLTERVGLGAFVVAVLAIFMTWRVAYVIAKPIEDITNVAKEVAEGNLSKRVRYRGKGELATLAQAVNHMAARLSEQLETVTYEKTKLESILSSMVAGVIVVDRSGRITYANESAANMFGYSVVFLNNKWHWEVGHNYGMSSLVDDAILYARHHKQEIHFHVPSDRTVEVNITPILDVYQNVIAAVVVLHDVSEWRRMERMRSEFVANVSHELRTPVTAVKGFAETLLDGALNDPETAKAFITIINDESERMTRLIADLLDLSRIESKQTILDKVTINLEQLIEDTVYKLEHHAQRAGIALAYRGVLGRASSDTSLESDVCVHVDPDRISQVLINLISNAIAYTGEGGSIEVWIEEQPDTYTVHVKDTGIGIPESDIPRLFERFYRVDKTRSRKSGGTGLGLAIVKHIVEAHKGKVHVYSVYGKGSDFSFTLPRV
ncbi:cell wall metabolism sensor histidine kinase WalK [Fodinisporobacter ferrooxydans]|uniref:histidine kinase n=1 Tax=Fodinisporobacter ferrooxydans TaxID=2901836 RepID=A0ABY4CQE6_9BACL|nr:cell wall metabolism sensor histidine kinase WalK [Alicyclobacillaceae bacterium MYW30-H2]